jgi:ABC-2 type transport system ATP-binding protein
MLKAGRVVALDTTRNLLANVAGLTVRLVAERVPAAWQHRVTSRDAHGFVVGLDSYADLEALLAALRTDAIPIAELALLETDLEQVFLRIMSGGPAPTPESGS